MGRPLCGARCDHDQHEALGRGGSFDPGPCELEKNHAGHPHKHGPHRWVNFLDMPKHVRRQICKCALCQAP